MTLLAALPVEAPARAPARAQPSFHEVYEQMFDFAWNLLRRLGVSDDALEDATQDVFLHVHRRLGDFEGRSSLKTWVGGIAVHIASDFRRARSRKGQGVPLPPTLADPRRGPLEAASAAEALRLVQTLLERLDDDQREVLVLVEMEQMTAPEISEALGINLNTVYSRLRLARKAFSAAAGERKSGEEP